MSATLNRIRQAAGVRGPGPSGSSPTGTIGTLLARSRPTRTAMVALRLPAILAGILAALAAGVHRPALEAVQESGSSPLRDVAVEILTVGEVDVWGPFVAAAAALALAAAAVHTGGFSQGTLLDTIATAVATVGGGVAAAPVVVAVAYGLVVLVVAITIVVAIAFAALALIAALLGEV